MKTKKWIGIIAAFLLLFSCSEVDKLLDFNIFNQASFTVQGGFPINSPLDIISDDITTNSNVAFAGNGTRTDKVKDIKLEELKLTITNPNDQNFSFLKSVHIFISTNDNDEILMAYGENINTSAKSLNLICIPQKLDNYIKATSYRLRTKVVMRETLSEDATVQVDSRLHVIADPL